MLTEPIQVTLQVTEALEALGIPYFITGSLASALHGVTRATMDVDLVADIRMDQIGALLDKLQAGFFADDQMIHDAVRQGVTFNLLHKEFVFKVDIFPVGDRAFDRAQFERRVAYPLTDQPERWVYVTSPEDIILSKLEWYFQAGETSPRHWWDVLNVLRIQGERIDRDYLDDWAAELGVSDLLARAFRDASKR
jgi:hypothetical protein